MSHAHMHDAGSARSDRRLIWALIINLLLTVAELVGGVLAGSLALVADAMHNLNDAASLFLAFLVRRIARKPADRLRTFGYRRAEMVGTLINMTTLMLIGGYLVMEAVMRYFEQEPVAGWIMIGVSAFALVVDLGTALLTYTMAKESLNIRAAFIHNVSDALGSVGVIVAGTLIIVYEWYIADLLVALLLGAYIAWQGASVLRQSVRMLMDSVPADIDLDDLAEAMRTVDGVCDVHHVHVWHLGERLRALEAHIVTDRRLLSEAEAIKRTLAALLRERFRIAHSTLEFEEDDGGACRCGEAAPGVIACPSDEAMRREQAAGE